VFAGTSSLKYIMSIYLILSYLILHSLICRVLLLLLLLLLLRNASDLRNCTSYFGACMWVWYCRPPIGAHFHPTPQPPPVPQQLGEKDGSPLRGVARLCRGRRSHSSCYYYYYYYYLKPIYSNSLSPAVLHQVPLYLRT